MKTKFLLFAGKNWTDLTRQLHWHTQPDYPLLLQSLNAWLYTLTGRDLAYLTRWNGILRSLLCLHLLYAGLKHLTSPKIAYAVTALLAFNPIYFSNAISQYADITLSYQILAILMCLLLGLNQKAKSYFLTAGLFAGLLTFTKNEGIVMAGLFGMILSAVLLLCPRQERKTNLGFWLAWVSGFILTCWPTLVFKICFAPANRDMMGGIDFAALKFFNLHGLIVLSVFTLKEILKPGWIGLWVMLLATTLLFLPRLFKKENKIGAFFFIGYGLVLTWIYLTTKNFDMVWRLVSTLERIMLYLLPGLLFYVAYCVWKRQLSNTIENTPDLGGAKGDDGRPQACLPWQEAPLQKSEVTAEPPCFERSEMAAECRSQSDQPECRTHSLRPPSRFHLLSSGLIFLSMLVLLIAAYWPALTTDYIFHDEVNLFMDPPMQQWPLTAKRNFIMLGRFVGAGIFTLTSWAVYAIHDLKFLRLFAVFFLAICAWFTEKYLRRIFQNRIISFAIAAAIFTLPPFNTFIMDGGMTFDEFGVVLAVFAIWAVSKIPAAAVLKDRLRNKW
ncbi:MAG: glycosyltransferase family 39 protein, partial [Candidatus Omnitrophica bacterium]|nr:glycosyltransferase family 39 protein [Candidatus Omnitrophota bacterium]